jgi:CRP-like cAMP-binding protein
LLLQGRLAHYLYVITDGQVIINRQEEGDTKPHEVARLSHISESPFIGENSILKNTPCTATVLAVGTVKCLALHRKDFLEYTNPENANSVDSKKEEELLHRETKSYEISTSSRFRLHESMRMLDAQCFHLHKCSFLALSSMTNCYATNIDSMALRCTHYYLTRNNQTFVQVC